MKSQVTFKVTLHINRQRTLKTAPLITVDTLPYFSVIHLKFCLQVEPCDESRRNGAADILTDSNNVVIDSGTPAAKEVNEFMSDGFYAYDNFSYIITYLWNSVSCQKAYDFTDLYCKIVEIVSHGIISFLQYLSANHICNFLS